MTKGLQTKIVSKIFRFFSITNWEICVLKYVLKFQVSKLKIKVFIKHKLLKTINSKFLKFSYSLKTFIICFWFHLNCIDLTLMIMYFHFDSENFWYCVDFVFSSYLFFVINFDNLLKEFLIFDPISNRSPTFYMVLFIKIRDILLPKKMFIKKPYRSLKQCLGYKNLFFLIRI